MRSVSWSPGWSEFTVTPSAATSRARVLRKPVAPARAVFERISSAIGCRTATEVIATTRPHPRSCIEGTAASHIAITERQLSSNAATYCSSSVRRERPRWWTACVRDEDVDATERVGRRGSRTRPPTWASRRRRLMALRRCRPAGRRLRSCHGGAPHIATRTPSAASAAATPKPSPRLAAATAARFPVDPEVHQPWIDPSVSRRDGAGRPVRRAMISAQIEMAVSSGVRGADVEADGRHHPLRDQRRRLRHRAAAPGGRCACASIPWHRCSRRRSRARPRGRGRRTWRRG